jgi:nucleotide-binding universal stress UspA family protein
MVMDGIRSIVVHVDASPRSEARLRIGQALARASGAQLTGLYAVTPAANQIALAVPEGATIMVPELEKIDRDNLQRAQALFGQVVGPASGPQAAWVDASDMPGYAAVAARALTADLLVMGQHDPADRSTAMDSDLVVSSVIESGTPALVVPHTGHYAPDALLGPDLCVLLAWKPTREASRAVRAALPWLKRARQVHLAVEAPAERGNPWPGAAQVQAWLQLHGVHVTLREHVLGRAEAGDMILSMAADVAADLLVMGCFGHSRAREMLLGGASRTVLRSMTLPTLLAH